MLLQHKFNVTQDVRVLTLNQKLAPYKSPNKQRIGELFIGFLRYFAYVFKYGLSGLLNIKTAEKLDIQWVASRMTGNVEMGGFMQRVSTKKQ